MRNSITSCVLGICALMSVQAQELRIVEYVSGIERPTDIQNAGDERLFVLEQNGRIRIIEDQQVLGSPFMDITNKVFAPMSAPELGLLGLAFHPNYAENGLFYVNYTRRNDIGATETVIAQYETTEDGAGDPASETILMMYGQPANNHNGGDLEFGPDGMLYISSGDGGAAADAFGNGQNIRSPLAAILRLDVDNPPMYIPEDNPYADGRGNDALWAYGLRNPWRIAFDSETGDLWIGDVGDNLNQAFYEEVNRIPAGESEYNFGWPCYEGTGSLKTGFCQDSTQLVFPTNQYRRGPNSRCSVSGGRVYRGSAFSDMVGKYVYADFCSGELFMINLDGSGFTAFPQADEPMQVGIGGFGIDVNQELYAFDAIQGKIYRIVDANDPNNLSTSDFTSAGITVVQQLGVDILSISGLDTAQATSLEVFNLQGQKVDDLSALISNTSEYSTSALRSGMYLLIARGDDQSQYIHKFVVN